MRYMIAVILVTLFCSGWARAELKSKTITYKHGDMECVGYLAWDDAVTGPRPGVLVLHEWWGLNDYARKRTDELAKLGYLAFAADMFGNGKTVDHPTDARTMVGQVRSNVDDWRKRATVALGVLTSQPECDKTKVAAIGYCFGGSTALQLSYVGADLKAVATFHAALPTPTAEEAKNIKAALLVCHGADDPFIPATAITAFKQPIEQAKVALDFVAYPGAQHSFTVESADAHGIEGMKYNRDADEKSWKKMLELFDRQFGKR